MDEMTCLANNFNWEHDYTDCGIMNAYSGLIPEMCFFSLFFRQSCCDNNVSEESNSAEFFFIFFFLKFSKSKI
jgi:hypothetical protein